MIRKHISLMAAVILFSSVANSQTVTIEDTPNPGDTTTVTTITTGNPVVTNNLLSQQWNDGTWTGTMFPDSSDINENIYLTGKDGAFAESTVNSQDILTEQELQQGLTSTLTAKVRWWNQWESTIEMKQTATNGIDTTTQTIILEDTTNHNNQFNSHTNTLVIAPDAENSHGTLTTRFTFDIDNAAGTWNNGHSGPDIIEPDLRLNYSSLSTTTVTDTVYCYQKSPPTCPAQQEIADVETFLDTFEEDLYLDDIYVYEEEYFMPEEVDIEYSFNTEIFEEDEFEIEEDYLTLDEFFFEDDYYQDDYYEEPFMEEFFPETLAFEEVEFFDEPPPMEMFTELPPMEEMYFEDEYFEEEMYVEVFTDEAFIEEFDEMFDEMPMEEIDMEMAEEMFEEMFEEYTEEEAPIEIVEEVIEEPMEEVVKEEEPLEEVAMVKEEPVQEEEPQQESIEETKDEQIEEQPSSKESTTDEPKEATDNKEQEEVIEKPIKGGAASEESGTSGPATGKSVEVDLDIKIAALEKVIQGKISNEMQRIELTLNAVNEIVAKEMTDSQPDMSSYFNMNAGLFDTRQLPSGDMNFFNGHINLASYNKDIYNTQPALSSTDPVAQYEVELIKAKDKTLKAYLKFKELLNARNDI